MIRQTVSQRMAQAAYQCIAKRNKVSQEFRSFARGFPSLVHACGLAQAVAFARTRKGPQHEYLKDLASVLAAAGHTQSGSVENLEKATRDDPVHKYVLLSRHALQAAGWLKRYVEAAEAGDKSTEEK